MEGSILVAIVLFLFLGEIRSAVVVIVTLPLAMLFAFLMMQHILGCRPISCLWQVWRSASA
jgi:Cu/Ag efflux pump CusA